MAALPAWLRRLGYYGLALLLVAVGVGVRVGLTHLVGPDLSTYITFYPLVMLAALIGGWGPGLLATVATAVVVDYWLLPPQGQFKPESFIDTAGLVFFAVMGIFMSIVAELYRRTRDHLEELVILRTTALNLANEHLQERGAQLQAQTEELTAVNTELRETEERFRIMADGSPNPIWVTNAEGERIFANKQYLEYFGITAKEMKGQGWQRFIHPADAPTYVHSFLSSLQEHRPFSAETRVRRADGQWRWIESHAEPRLSREGEFLGFVGMTQDITERKAAEAAIKESEEKYRAIVETATEAIVMVDAEARIVFVNDHWSEMFGYRREEALRMTHFELVFPEDLAPMQKRWELRKRGHKESYEVRLRRKDGSPVWALLGVAPQFGPEGQFLGTLVMAADITERKKAEEALRDLNTTLESRVAQRTEQLEQRAGQLQKLSLELTEAEERERARIAEILHNDLQQVLAATKFQIGLLSSRVKKDADSQEIAGQATHLLVEAIAKARSLSHELSSPALSQRDLRVAFDWLAEQMQKKHGLTVHLEMGPQIEVGSEPLRILLYKAVQEMLFNVIKHAGVNEAKVRLRHQHGCLRLTVSDQGRGFDPTAPGYTLGFGLLSIRERIALLGGRLTIRSTPGKGSRFFVVVPDGHAPRQPRKSNRTRTAK